MSDRCVKFYFSGSPIVYAYEEDTELIQLCSGFTTSFIFFHKI